MMSTGTLFQDPTIVRPGREARPRILLLHGYLGSGASWGRVAPQLEAFADVFSPDLRGHGWAQSHDRGYTLEHVVRDLSPVFAEFRPTHVVGHSLGALVALAASAAHADSVRRVGVVGLPVFASAPEGYDHQAARGLVRRVLMRAHRWSHPGCVVAREFVPAWEPLAARLAPRYPRAVLRGLFRHSAEAHVQALEGIVFRGLAPALAANLWLPVASLHGTRDETVPMEPARKLALESGWEFDPVPGASHELLFERPETVARWLARRVLFGNGDQSRRSGSGARRNMPGHE